LALYKSLTYLLTYLVVVVAAAAAAVDGSIKLRGIWLQEMELQLKIKQRRNDDKDDVTSPRKSFDRQSPRHHCHHRYHMHHQQHNDCTESSGANTDRVLHKYKPSTPLLYSAEKACKFIYYSDDIVH